MAAVVLRAVVRVATQMLIITSTPLHRLLFVIGIAFAALSTSSFATPQLSLLSGNRCTNCHVSPSGGGVRTELGWYSMYDVGILSREDPIISWLYPPDSTNVISESAFSWGADGRVQITRSFADSNAPRVAFPMQATLYGVYQPMKAMSIDASFNLAGIRKAPNSDKFIRYPGQRLGTITMNLTPSFDLPSVRLGLFRPSVGVRYDDHTMYPFSYVSSTSRQTLLAPNWAEYGSELTWEKLLWLTTQLGIFGSEGLSQVSLYDGEAYHSAVNGNQPTITGRVVVWPKLFDNLMNTYAGGSLLLNNDFSIISVFGGVGLTDDLSMMVEYTQISKESVMSSATGMVELMYAIIPPILVYARYEVGRTTYEKTLPEANLSSIILGSQIFLMPFVELRPEYRIQDSELPGYTSRWNLQLHLFY